MPTTPTYALPYPPAVGVPPDVPYWQQQLAEAVEAAIVARKTPKVATGAVNVTVTAAAAGTATIAFPAGRFSAAPRLVATRSSGAGFAGWTIETANVTATSADITLRSPGGSLSGTMGVTWIAVQEAP